MELKTIRIMRNQIASILDYPSLILELRGLDKFVEPNYLIEIAWKSYAKIFDILFQGNNIKLQIHVVLLYNRDGELRIYGIIFQENFLGSLQFTIFQGLRDRRDHLENITIHSDNLRDKAYIIQNTY
jgi:hypothetical protein